MRTVAPGTIGAGGPAGSTWSRAGAEGNRGEGAAGPLFSWAAVDGAPEPGPFPLARDLETVAASGGVFFDMGWSFFTTGPELDLPS